VGFLAVAVLACAMPYTHAERGHVGVSLLTQKLSSRAQAVIDSITSLAAFILFMIVSWQMWLYAISLKIAGEVSMAIEIPVYPFIFGVSVCFAVLCLVIFLDVVNLIGKAVRS
jgi:TRAP-type C4-dicarboxylate transport system permease small subunit